MKPTTPIAWRRRSVAPTVLTLEEVQALESFDPAAAAVSRVIAAATPSTSDLILAELRTIRDLMEALAFPRVA